MANIDEPITALTALTVTQPADLLAIVDLSATPTTKKITVSNLLAGAGGSTITVADESTDTTCFPVFVTSATGVLGPKSNAAGLTFNSATGDLSATSIAGILAGNLLDRAGNGVITGTLTCNNILDCKGGVSIPSANNLKLFSADNSTTAQFDYSDSIFQTVFVNTVSWNITGTTLKVARADIPSMIQDKLLSYTLVLTDGGQTIRFTGAMASKVLTIPSNASVAFTKGTLIAVHNDGSVTMTLAITSDTLTFAKDNTTGTRTLAAGASLVLQKVATTSWKVGGSALVT